MSSTRLRADCCHKEEYLYNIYVQYKLASPQHWQFICYEVDVSLGVERNSIVSQAD